MAEVASSAAGFAHASHYSVFITTVALPAADDKQAIAMPASQLMNDSDGTSWVLFGKRKEQAHYLNR